VIKDITSALTTVGGKVVHGEGEFAKLSPALPPRARTYGGYQLRAC
jgi:hypothetical protein